MRGRVFAWTLLLVPIALVACNGGAPASPDRARVDTPALQPAAAQPAAAAASPLVLASGELTLPAAQAFGDPGFHEILTATAVLPADFGPTAGRRLILALRDASRPRQTCDQEHPLSGCATVDWSDFEDRPNVPPGGVFDQYLTLQTADGPRTFFLSAAGTLAAAADPYEPG